MNDVTRLLNSVVSGEKEAASQLATLVYVELRSMAAQKMARERAGQTIQATALVHEAWLRLGGDQQQHWQNRAHFFSAASEAMRRILVDNARRKNAIRHGAGLKRVDADDSAIQIAATGPDEELLEIHEALDRFAAEEPLKAELVKLRYFVGLTLEEAAEVLHIAVPTAKRYWAFARAWLYRELKRSNSQ